jgi:hypothetical protein
VHDKGIVIREEVLAGTPKMSVSSMATPQFQSCGMLSREQFLHLFNRFTFLASQLGMLSSGPCSQGILIRRPTVFFLFFFLNITGLESWGGGGGAPPPPHDSNRVDPITVNPNPIFPCRVRVGFVGRVENWQP